MTLDHVLPRPAEPVYLNNELVFSFSAEVDLASLTRRNLSIVDDAGAGASGEWDVLGKNVHFHPAPALSADLSDGGFRPGVQYRVEVRGFPSLDGVRAVGGAPLDRTYRWSFRSVSPEDGEQLFLDYHSPGRAEVARVKQVLGSQGPIRIECDEPLDPTTLHGSDFELSGPEGPPIALEARLLENRGRTPFDSARHGAVIALVPERTLAPGQYLLSPSPDLALRDFGRNKVRIAGSGAAWTPGVIPLTVPEVAAAEGRGTLELSFLDDQMQMTAAVPGADGTALWEAGRVSVPYPAAAGSGAAGPVVLASEEPVADLHATRIELPAGVTCRLAPGPGLRVLRAQGKIVLAGKLVRDVATDDVMDLEGDDPFAPKVALSHWLREARERDPTWTVILAGGDLVIEGSVEVSTPLLLVAGGWIRVQRPAVVTAVERQPSERQLWLLGRGGGLDMWSPARRVDLLWMDPPRDNPLKQPLKYSAVSSLVPATTPVRRWLSAGVRAWTGHGSFEVRYLPERSVLDPADGVLQPAWLPRPGPVRVWIELVVPPGPVWDPPFVDSVSLSWE